MDKTKAEESYVKCKTIIDLLGDISTLDSTASTLVWMLEDYFAKLGDAIGTTPLK